MSDSKDKKTGSGPEKKPGGQNTGKKPAGKRVAKKPEDQAPKRSTGGVQKSPEKQPPLTSQQKILKGLYIALTVVSAVIVLAYIGVNLFAAPPNVDRTGLGGVVDLTRPPQATTTIDPLTGEEIEIEIPGLPADRKKEFYTFLLIGQDQANGGGGLTDTMMLVAYDVPDQTLSVMNLPRDTYVRFRGDAVLLNSVYNRSGGGERGLEALKQEVRELTGVYPDYHVVIQWEALGELVDAIDGVYFEVPFDMYYNEVLQHFKIDLKKGYQLLDGDKAMQLVRWRQNSDRNRPGKIDNSYGYRDGDLGRIKTQQQFMKAIIAKCLQPEVLLPNLMEYISIFQKNVETNLTASNMAYFGKSAITGLDMDNVSFVTMPNNYAGDGHLVPIGGQIVKAVNESFNPYQEDIRLGELSLATLDDVPRQSVDPEETEDPDATEDPDSTESPRPGDEDVVLPPGSFTRPSASPNPSGSPAPSGSVRPSESPRPSESGRPGESPRAAESTRPSGIPGGLTQPGNTSAPTESGGPSPTPAPVAEPTSTPAAPEPTPAPALTPPPAEEEPLLPPM